MKVEDHIQYWMDSAADDLDTAEKLFLVEKFDWCLFLGHLVLEKALKAHYVQDNENQMPPRVHNLVKLAKKTQLPLNEDLILFLDEVTDFNLEVRYPEYKKEFQKRCTKEFCETRLTKIREHYQWLKSLIRFETS
ncbi:MAG: HEPN domain-containing protein [Nitrospina sp.]|jgi:HEPN domain-containing protein|nr:HEPN domain-containing protein [Nitrospina sp.]